MLKKSQQQTQSDQYEEAGDHSKDNAKSKSSSNKGRTKIDPNTIAQQAGLNKKPSTGKNPEPQPEESTQDSKPNSGMGESRAPGENNLFANTDSTGKSAGEGNEFTAIGIPENMELIARQYIVNFNGKGYLILAQSKRTFSNDGLPLAEDTYFESFEIKGTEQIRDGVLLWDVEPGKILRERLHITHDLVNRYEKS